MPLLRGTKTQFKLGNFNDDIDYDYVDEYDEANHGLVIRGSKSYSTRTDKSFAKRTVSARETSDTASVNQAIACALKSRPKIFYFTQKNLQYLPPSIQHLQACDTIRELDLHGNKLKSLPKELEGLKSIEVCNLGKIKYLSNKYNQT